MIVNPLAVASQSPGSFALPLVLVGFSLVTRLGVHKEPFIDFVHGVPPRLALAANGVLFSVVVSLARTLARALSNEPSGFLVAILILVVFFLSIYVGCEAIAAAASSGTKGDAVKGQRRLPWSSAFGGALAIGLTSLGTFYATRGDVYSAILNESLIHTLAVKGLSVFLIGAVVGFAVMALLFSWALRSKPLKPDHGVV
jgi:hypothetical protein